MGMITWALGYTKKHGVECIIFYQEKKSSYALSLEHTGITAVYQTAERRIAQIAFARVM